MSISKRTMHDAQASPDNPSEKKSAQAHTRDLFVWLKQVNRDSNLACSDFKVAFAIGEHFNRESGEAWPSTTTIAEESGLSQPTVVASVGRLVAAGHLGIERGRQGRGHSHRYRLILKHRPADISSPRKYQRPDISGGHKTPKAGNENPKNTEIKYRRADMNNLKNNLSNNQERAFGPRSADDVRESPALDTETSSDSAYAGRLISGAPMENQRDQAYAKLWDTYPYHLNPDSNADETDAREEFDRLLDRGVNPDHLITAAAAYAKRCDRANPSTIDFMVYWLRSMPWTN